LTVLGKTEEGILKQKGSLRENNSKGRKWRLQSKGEVSEIVRVKIEKIVSLY
jgi:hypothetical protein